MIFIAASALALISDQLSKFIVRRYMVLGQSKTVIKGLLSITHINNSGAAFGLLPNKQWLFLLVALAAIVIAVIYILKNKQTSNFIQLALGLAVGGALGNLTDRFLFGKVTDFIDFHFWPVFNIADSSIFIGMFLLIIIVIIEPKTINKIEENI